MKINDIAKEIAKREGKKSIARMGDIKEMLGILSDIIAENKESYGGFNPVIFSIALLGLKRSKKKNTKKRVKAQAMDRETESDYIYAFVMLLATGIYFGFYLMSCVKLLEYMK